MDWLVANGISYKYQQYTGYGLGVKLHVSGVVFRIQLAAPYTHDNGMDISESKWHIAIQNAF